MAVVLNSNVMAMNAQRRLANASQSLGDSFERLSSGLRINSGADDAAGLSIATSLKTDSRVYTQGTRNMNEAINALTISQGALSELSSVAIRISELAEQAANEVISLPQRKSLHAEAQALTEEFNRIVHATEYNGFQLLDNSISQLLVQSGYGSNGETALSVNHVLAHQQGSGEYEAGTPLSATSVFRTAAVDINGDGNTDLIATLNGGGNQLQVRLGVGDGSFGSATVFQSGLAAHALAVEDLNKDGKHDIVVSDYGGRFLVLAGNGNGTFTAGRTFSDLAGTSGAQIVDINNDGKLDVVTFSETTDSFRVSIGNGDGSLKAGIDSAGGDGNKDGFVGDLNGDGIFDVAVADYTGFARIRFGNNDGSFRNGGNFAAGNGASSLSGADFNRDGLSDLAVSSALDNRVTVLLGNGDGSFRVGTSYAAGLYASTVVATDISGDGYIDFGVASGNDDRITFYLGNGNGTFQAPHSFALGGNYETGLAFGDFRGIGVLDAAVPLRPGNAIALLKASTTSVTTLEYTSLLTSNDARKALDTAKGALARVSGELANIGSAQSRLEFGVSNLLGIISNSEQAASQIFDVDVAAESSSLVRAQILSQASAAILAQANQQPGLALDLLSNL